MANPPQRILVVRLRMLGDTLLATPLVRQLKRLYPDAEVDVLCQPNNGAIFLHSPHVAHRRLLRRKAPLSELRGLIGAMRRRRYDLAIDLHALPKTAWLTLASGAQRRIGYRKAVVRGPLCYTESTPRDQMPFEYNARRNLRLLGDDRVDFDDLDLEFPISPADEAFAQRFNEEHLPGKTVAMYVISQDPNKSWPPEKFALLADRLSERGYTPLMVYGPGQERSVREVTDRMRTPAVIDYPMPTFPQLMGVMRRCDLFVGNDGGPHHLAATAGLPMVSLFQISPVEWTRPHREHQRFVASTEVQTPCDSCGRFVDEPFKEIPADAVWEEVERVLEISEENTG
ncbi:Lipopolysaccharide core heptosyltransferase RfaQ [Posidoniimonas polymericola]|uniref:Lipopolysaccharide core heptosyltransferase RfaQ n=1 Tax=Posidoniimonas polymericola TaxID=2528002 RepID=A0A5C5YAR7_9BACT|nr:glycosyltransferase family 9 protein [Posidoniimonas polymericola]TWT72787.1 Lipopolysaccharide core heptosyltransferase RfaQ [Posidoniimonas polymericola]